jgi:hypothetical protein
MVATLLLTDDRTTKRNVTPKVDIAGHCQMVELDDLWNLLETFLELLDLYRTSQPSLCNQESTSVGNGQEVYPPS